MKRFQTFLRLFSATAIIASLALQVLTPTMASAAQISDRTLLLKPGATDGGSKAGGVVNHHFTFTIPTGGSIGAVKFEYCTLASGTCVVPTGLDTTAATIVSESGASGFNMVNLTNGAPYLTRTAAAVPAAQVLVYELGMITNPTTVNQTFHVRISTHTATDASDAAIDTGTVTSSTAEQIIIDGTMPESLVFCTGGTVGVNGSGVIDCSTATSGIISFNQLFSPTDTATATSQMAASTNAGAGYNITVAGPTLTSGSNTITAMPATTGGVRGTSQFGMNLKANTVTTSTPAVGIEVNPAANALDFKGQAALDYDTIDMFKFVSGNSVANSYNGGPGGSDAQIFTASYIVNVPGNQPAGTYTTTLTYIATPSF